MKRLTASLLAVLALAVPARADEPARCNRNAGKRVALTFDDGPHREYTEEILKILEENGVRATFFVIGENAGEYPDRVKMISDAGHEIGNHTYSHAMINRLSETELKSEIERAQKAILDACGTEPKVFRPPYGAYNDRSIGIVEEMGFRCVLWSQDSRDWQLPPSESIVSAIAGSLSEGDVLLFHDYNRPESPTPSALRALIPMAKSAGWEFVTVSELFEDAPTG
ncbi:MAG: polysaccharide deacetylase family protein [Clostridia bacterium]|nr:polysaccharide deacetylase family protein [Clostridia bacterium]